MIDDCERNGETARELASVAKERLIEARKRIDLALGEVERVEGGQTEWEESNAGGYAFDALSELGHGAYVLENMRLVDDFAYLWDLAPEIEEGDVPKFGQMPPAMRARALFAAACEHYDADDAYAADDFLDRMVPADLRDTYARITAREPKGVFSRGAERAM